LPESRVTKVYDPDYFDEKGKAVYAKTIEEYTKVLGSSWYSVSWCDNNTMVNSIGVFYYDVSSIQRKLRRRDNQTPIEKSPLECGEPQNHFQEATIPLNNIKIEQLFILIEFMRN